MAKSIVKIEPNPNIEQKQGLFVEDLFSLPIYIKLPKSITDYFDALFAQTLEFVDSDITLDDFLTWVKEEYPEYIGTQVTFGDTDVGLPDVTFTISQKENGDLYLSNISFNEKSLNSSGYLDTSSWNAYSWTFSGTAAADFVSQMSLPYNEIQTYNKAEVKGYPVSELILQK